MKLVFTSDLHGLWNTPELELAAGGDILVLAGDVLSNHRPIASARETANQLVELADLCKFVTEHFKHVVLVPGNHDWCFQRSPYAAEETCKEHGVNLLIGSSVELEGLTFYGSPWTPWFHNWAFNFPNPSEDSQLAEETARHHWRGIPDSTNILVTHGPPHKILDKTQDGREVGCPFLAARIKQLPNLGIHVFGHIHESAGTTEVDGVLFINAAALNLQYNLNRLPTVVTLQRDQQ